MNEIEAVTEASRARRLLHPLRQKILENARQPVSATELGRRLGLPRQNVNYHVRELARAGFLRAAGRRRRRNLIEKQYVATADAYVLMPEVLGPAGPVRAAAQDAYSAGRLMTLTATAQSELAQAGRGAAEQGKRLATLSMDAELRFESADQRAAFARALQDALAEAIARHSSPVTNADGTPAAGRSFRLILGIYPIPSDRESTKGEEA